MRNLLTEYENEFVQCRGWIAHWEDLPECSTRRVVVQQPTIKKANKDILYDNQAAISTEHHLNLFIKHSDIIDYGCDFALYSPINFTGYVNGYTRSDGTFDYGVYANKQSTIEYRLEKLEQSIEETFNSEDFPSLDYVESALNQALLLLSELEGSGDCISTFYHTYGDMKDSLSSLVICMNSASAKLKGIISSRKWRRTTNKKQSKLGYIASLRKTGATKGRPDLRMLENGFDCS